MWDIPTRHSAIAFNLNDDAALDEVTRGVVIRCKVIEVPSFGGGLGN